MEIIAGTTQFYLMRETAVAIGKFDGVHLGHRRLLQELLEQKKKGLAACIFTFDPPPTVLFGTSDGKELTTVREKRLLFERMGVDVLIEFPLNRETAAMSPEFFVRRILAEQMNARFIAAGTDLSFGHRGAGNAELLRRLGSELGFSVKMIDKLCIEDAEVNSTYIRELLKEGDMERVELFLGVPYMVMGTVVHGRQIGRKLGFPTVNLLPEEDKLLPPNGVYESEVFYRGRKFKAISNVGCKPTVTQDKIAGVESYLYDFSENIYGEEIEVYLKAFRRPEQRFDSLEALQAQLQQDVKIL